MRFNVKFAVAAALAAIAFAACSSSSKPASSSSTNPPPEATTTTTAGGSSGASGSTGGTGAATVKLATVTVKGESEKILVDSNGMTLYVDENDKPGAPACTAGCLQAWPPLKATGTAIKVGPGLTASKYTVVTASDGTKQVAVNGSPLYTWMSDAKPGDATGQDVNGFYVVQANGVKYDPS